MKAFWTIRPNIGDGSRFNPNRPALPTGCTVTTPGDINLLTGGHNHVLLGGVTLPAEDGHYHYIVDGEQITVGGTPHRHADTTPQDYFLCFVVCDDETHDEILAEPYNATPVAYAEIVDGDVGDLVDEPWDAVTEQTLRTIASNVFGWDMPTEIDSGKKLISAILGSFLSRKVTNERAYR